MTRFRKHLKDSDIFMIENSFETHLYIYWIGRDLIGGKVHGSYRGWFLRKVIEELAHTGV